MATAQIVLRIRPVSSKHHMTATSQKRRAETPLFQAFSRHLNPKSTGRHCIKDATTIDTMIANSIQSCGKVQSSKAIDTRGFGDFVFGDRKAS